MAATQGASFAHWVSSGVHATATQQSHIAFPVPSATPQLPPLAFVEPPPPLPFVDPPPPFE